MKLKVLYLMKAKDRLKIFAGTNILHSEMLLQPIFNFNLILPKIWKILSLNKPKTLQLKAQVNLMWKLNLFTEHLNLKSIIFRIKVIFKILFRLSKVEKKIVNNM